MADSTIGKAFVQIVPSADGITEKMNAALGAPSREAGTKAGTEMSGSMGAALSSGLLSAVSGIASKIAGAMKTALSEVSSFVADSVSVGSAFDSQMSQIAATMGMTTEDIKNNVKKTEDATMGAGETFDMLREKAKEMGAATNFSAAQAAEGLNILAMSGYDAEKSVSMIEDVLHLAAAGGMDMATAAADISGAMKGFNDATKDSAYYADLMAKGATLANTNVTQLGEALSGAAAQGAAYKQDADDMTLALLRLAEQGETGSNAATMLGAAMKNLYTPTDQAKAAMEELGVKAYDQQGNFKDINTVVNELNKSLGKYSDEQQAAYINTIFGIQGQEAYNKMVVTSVEKQEEWAAALKNSSGEAAKQYTTMTDNLAGDIDIWNSALEGFKIEIADGVMPTVREFVQFGSEGLGRLTEAFKSGGITGMAEELGVLLGELSDKVTKILPDVLDVFTKLGTSVIENLANALPTIVTAVQKAIPQIVASLGKIGDSLVQTFPSIIDAVISLVTEIANLLPTLLPQIASALVTALPAIVNGIVEILPVLIETIVQVVDTVAQLLPEIIPPVFEAVVNAIPMLAQVIADNLPVIVETLTGLVMSIAELIPDIIPVLIPAVTQAVCTLIDGIAAAMEKLPELIGAIVDITMAVADAILDNLPLFIDCAVQIMSAMGKAIYDHFPEIMDAFGKLFVKIVDAIEDWFPKIWKAISGLWTKLIDGIKNGWDGFVQKVYEWGDSVLEAVGGIWTDIKDFWGGVWDSVVEIGSNIIAGIWEGIKQEWQDLKDGIFEFGETVVETFCDIFGINSPSKVLEDEVGKYLAQGVGVGFEKEMDEVTKQMGSEVSGVIDELTGAEMNANFNRSMTYTQAPAVTSAAVSETAYTSPSQKKTPATVVLQLNGREIAEASFEDMNELLGKTTTLQARGIAR